jgi:TonB family protein
MAWIVNTGRRRIACLLSLCTALAPAGFPQEAQVKPAVVKPTITDAPLPDSVSKAMGLRPGESGTVALQICVDQKGKVVSVAVSESSGNPRVDEVALALAAKYKFKPGTVDGKRTAQCVAASLRVPSLPDESAAKGNSPARVVYRPEPPMIDAAPVSGRARESATTRVEVCIDDTGRILKTTIEKSSNDADLDQVALRFARAHRFEPALKGGKPEESCLTLPVAFVFGTLPPG